MVKRCIFLFVIIIFLSITDTSARNWWEKDTEQATSQSKASCVLGRKQCSPFARNPSRYSSCMSRVCKPEAHEALQSETEKTPIDTLAEGESLGTCELGLRKCNVLRNEYQAYSRCMIDVCKNPEENADASCAEGHEACRIKLVEYYACNRLICGTKEGYETCEQSENACAKPLQDYWNCVSNTCLGDVWEYRQPPPETRTVTMVDENGVSYTKEVEYVPQPMAGVDPKFQYAPEGVSQEDWLKPRPHIGYRMVHSPSLLMTCGNRAEMMHCSSMDVRSCKCSGGSPAVSRHGKKLPLPFPQPLRVPQKYNPLTGD